MFEKLLGHSAAAAQETQESDVSIKEIIGYFENYFYDSFLEISTFEMGQTNLMAAMSDPKEYLFSMLQNMELIGAFEYKSMDKPTLSPLQLAFASESQLKEHLKSLLASVKQKLPGKKHRKI